MHYVMIFLIKGIWRKNSDHEESLYADDMLLYFSKLVSSLPQTLTLFHQVWIVWLLPQAVDVKTSKDREVYFEKTQQTFQTPDLYLHGLLDQRN